MNRQSNGIRCNKVSHIPLFSYEYSRQRDRMWRKTRSNTGGSCKGVDPNRNWGYKWGGKGASANTCRLVLQFLFHIRIKCKICIITSKYIC